MTKIVIFFIMLLACFYHCSLSEAKSYTYKINEDYALQLVVETTCCEKPAEEKENLEKYKVKYFNFGNIPTRKQPFLLFGSYGDSGAYAINLWTGNVWDLWDCTQMSTDLLENDRKKIRQGFTLQEIKQYDNLAAIKPECWN